MKGIDCLVTENEAGDTIQCFFSHSAALDVL